MKCVCGGETSVKKTRDEGAFVRRRRECDVCGLRVWTVEVVDVERCEYPRRVSDSVVVQ